MLPPLSPEALLDEVVRAPRRAYILMPDSQVIERPGWLQLVTPSFRQGGFNEVALSVLADDEADAVIDATLAQYAALGIRWRWNIDPDTRPLDLGERLARRGMKETVSRGMARSTAVPVDAPADVTVEVVDASTVELYATTMGAGWNIDPAPILRSAQLAIARPSHQLVLARIGGEPAGIAAMVVFPRSVYLMNGVVLPRFRRRGVYQAMVAARLADAHARGIELATTRAIEATSAPRLEGLGFETICRLTSFSP